VAGRAHNRPPEPHNRGPRKISRPAHGTTRQAGGLFRPLENVPDARYFWAPSLPICAFPPALRKASSIFSPSLSAEIFSLLCGCATRLAPSLYIQAATLRRFPSSPSPSIHSFTASDRVPSVLKGEAIDALATTSARGKEVEAPPEIERLVGRLERISAGRVDARNARHA
jgi:hypothetical protein